MISLKPFDIMRWELDQAPDREFLQQMLTREGLQSTLLELAARSHSPEVKYERPCVHVVVSGHVQYAFPGYGAIELNAGDILEINPQVLHDTIVLNSDQPALILQAFR